MPRNFILFVFLGGFIINDITARAINITNSWFLPEENFPVFYRYFKDKVTWSEAAAICEFHHAQLVTVGTSSEQDAAKAYLKELDVIHYVWIGLKKDSLDKPFIWLNDEELFGDGNWQAPVPKSDEPLCTYLDPAANYRWNTATCSGPETGAFICELPVPEWAAREDGCMISSLPSLTITLLPELGAIELASDCGLDGTRRIACKGGMNHDEMIRLLSCDRLEEFESPSTASRGTTDLTKSGHSTVPVTKGWNWQTYEPQTRHRRDTNPSSPSTTQTTDTPEPTSTKLTDIILEPSTTGELISTAKPDKIKEKIETSIERTQPELSKGKPENIKEIEKSTETTVFQHEVSPEQIDLQIEVSAEKNNAQHKESEEQADIKHEEPEEQADIKHKVSEEQADVEHEVSAEQTNNEQKVSEKRSNLQLDVSAEDNIPQLEASAEITENQDKLKAAQIQSTDIPLDVEIITEFPQKLEFEKIQLDPKPTIQPDTTIEVSTKSTEEPIIVKTVTNSIAIKATTTENTLSLLGNLVEPNVQLNKEGEESDMIPVEVRYEEEEKENNTTFIEIKEETHQQTIDSEIHKVEEMFPEVEVVEVKTTSLSEKIQVAPEIIQTSEKMTQPIISSTIVPIKLKNISSFDNSDNQKNKDVTETKEITTEKSMALIHETTVNLEANQTINIDADTNEAIILEENTEETQKAVEFLSYQNQQNHSEALKQMSEWLNRSEAYVISLNNDININNPSISPILNDDIEIAPQILTEEQKTNQVTESTVVTENIGEVEEERGDEAPEEPPRPNRARQLAHSNHLPFYPYFLNRVLG